MSRVVVCISALAVVAVSTAGCSSESEQKRGAADRPRESEFLALRSGASPAEVREQLGIPDDEAALPTLGGESSLDAEQTLMRYGAWVLFFVDERLTRVTREPPGASGLSGKSLDAEVLGLHLGISIDAVESTLGRPGSYVREFGPEGIERLYYGPWTLTFVDGRLDVRTKH